MVRQFSQQGPMMLTGMVADRFGYRATLTIGFLLRGLGFIMFAFGTSPWWMFLSAIVAGIGGSLFEPTGDAALTTLTDVQSRSRTYAVKKVSDNLGIVSSALVGSLLVSQNFHLLCIISGAVFVVAGVMTYLRLPAIQVQVRPIAWTDMWKTVTRDKPFVHFVAVMVGYFFLFMQLYLAIPTRVVEITHHAASVSVIFLVLSILMIAFQVPMNLWVARFPLVQTIQAGFLLMGAGLLVLGYAQTMVVFVCGMGLFAFGMMTIEPASFDLTARLSNPEMTATYFGFYYLAMAVGGGVSQGTGGMLLQVGQSVHHPALIWWITTVVALASVIGAGPLRKTVTHKSN